MKKKYNKIKKRFSYFFQKNMSVLAIKQNQNEGEVNPQIIIEKDIVFDMLLSFYHQGLPTYLIKYPYNIIINGNTLYEALHQFLLNKARKNEEKI